jgi:hypothetical protein
VSRWTPPFLSATKWAVDSKTSFFGVFNSSRSDTFCAGAKPSTPIFTKLSKSEVVGVIRSILQVHYYSSVLFVRRQRYSS